VVDGGGVWLEMFVNILFYHYFCFMATIDIKARLHNLIDHLSDAQLQKLYAFLIEILPEKKKDKNRKLGTMPGLITYMAPDFDEPLDDFKDYMPE